MNIKEKVNELNKDITLVAVALKRNDTPILAKIVACICVGYALSPIDLIPDFVPVLGYLDDVLLLPTLIALTLKLIPKDIIDDSRKEANDIWASGKPRKWYYALPIILIWILIIVLIIKLIKRS